MGAGKLISSTSDDGTDCLVGPSCLPSIMLAVGAVVGYFVGREADQRYGFRYRSGAPLDPPEIRVELASEPLLVAATESLVAVAVRGGVRMFEGHFFERRLVVDPEVALRARGLRQPGALAIVPRSGALALGSASGFYVFPAASGRGVIVREGRTEAIAASEQRVFFGSGTRVEFAPVGADSARAWPGIDIGAIPRALALDTVRDVLWVAAGDSLIALRHSGGSLQRIAALPAPGTARALAIAGDRLAVALGPAGVRLYDVSDALSPREVMIWNGARFVYDVSLAGRRLFAAAGAEGVYVFDVGEEPRTLGLARGLGFAVALASAGRYTYIIDRSSQSLRRIHSNF